MNLADIMSGPGDFLSFKSFISVIVSLSVAGERYIDDEWPVVVLKRSGSLALGIVAAN